VAVPLPTARSVAKHSERSGVFGNRARTAKTPTR
jgi:hypothetical protein